VEEPEAPESTKVIDLMARLQESLEQSKAGHKRKSGRATQDVGDETAAAPKRRRPSGNRTRRRRTA
jgi:non-homologous end joining protein Ku